MLTAVGVMMMMTVGVMMMMMMMMMDLLSLVVCLKATRRELATADEDVDADELPDVLCQRCFSLTHYG